ncbi:MAG: MFS transporter [Deltaproteobacteria bacterium]|nr:MAG: MFS transporter [Deltaproteobacteria bacterium]
MLAKDQPSASATYSGPQNRSALINFSLCIFTFTTANWMLIPFLPVYMKGQGLTDAEIGSILGVLSISALVVMLPLGVLSDLFSPKRLILLGGMIFLLFAGGVLRSKTYWQFLLIVPLGGVAASVFFIVLYALFLKTVGNGRLGKKIAFYQSGIYLGFGVGPTIAGVLIREDDFGMLLLGAVIGGVLLIVLVLRLPESDTIRLDLRGYHSDLRQGRTLLFLVLVMVYGTHFGVEQTTFTLLMKENLGFSAPLIGLVYLSVGCWMAFIAPFAGHRFDVRRSIRAFLWAGLVLSGTFQILTSIASSVPSMILLRLAHTLGDVLMILSMGLMTATFFPESRLGGNSAVVYATRTCGIFAGNVGAGYLNGALGYSSSFVASGTFLLLFFILAGSAVGRLLVVGDDLSSQRRLEHGA